MKKNNSVIGMVVKLCLAFMGATLGAVYFILNFTVSPITRDVREIWRKVYEIDVKIEGIRLLVIENPATTTNNERLDSLESKLRDTLAIRYPDFIQKEISQ